MHDNFHRSCQSITAANLYADYRESFPLEEDLAAWRRRWLGHRRAGASVFMAAVKATAEGAPRGSGTKREYEALKGSRYEPGARRCRHKWIWRTPCN